MPLLKNETCSISSIPEYLTCYGAEAEMGEGVDLFVQFCMLLVHNIYPMRAEL
jgi:hypothetical protein